MKNSIYCLLISMVIFTSCKDGHDGADKEGQPVKDLVEKVVQEKDQDTACFSSYDIYPATAWVWSESYVSYEKEKSKKPGAIKSNDTITSPVVLFAIEKLVTLRLQIDIPAGVEAKEGVLLYYIMATTTDSAPSLAMVNTVNCRLANTEDANCSDCTLVSWSKGNGNYPKQEFISSDKLKEYKSNWQKFMDGIQVDDPGFTEVNGYNYSWETLDIFKDEKAIAIKYGLRTLEPSDSQVFRIKDTTMTGSVVLANVLVGKSDINEDNTFANLADLKDLDFALPCPDFCGDKK